MRAPTALLGLACLAGLLATASAGCFAPLPTLLAAKQTAVESLLGKLSVSKGGSIVSSVCPGFTYDVHVQFPDPRNFFITATKGFFLGLLPSSSCPNQMTNNATGAAANTFDWQFSVSCAVSGSAVLSLASLPAGASVYKWFNFSIPLLPLSNTTCLGTPCNLAYLSAGVGRVVPAYGQCGGAGGECTSFYCDDKPFPGTSCTAGWSCVRQHRWYYQCLPGGSTSGSTTTTTTTAPAPLVVNGTAIPKYGQCGGAGGVCSQYGACADAAFSGYTCDGGFACQRQQMYYWQCAPPAGASATSAAPAPVPASGSSILPFAQCGGNAGICSLFGACADAAFPGYACPSGWSCQRQSGLFHQCLPAGSLLTATGSLSTGIVAVDNFFGPTWATMTKSLGLSCTNTTGLARFVVDPLAMPKVIDPLAILNIFAGLVAWKVDMASKLDPLSLLVAMKQLCGLVPQTNTTESVLVVGMSKFLTVMVDKVLPGLPANDTAIPAAAVTVLGALGAAATSGGFDLSKTFSLEGMLSVITAFGKLLGLMKLFKLL